MICKRPYMRTTGGKIRSVYAMGYQARNALTPFPCGQCLHCRINKAREWTARILFEDMACPFSVFTTLTYDDENLPAKNSLKRSDLTDFIRKSRKKLKPLKFRFFAVGEYGEDGEREINPHYHLVMFGVSETMGMMLDKCWKKGLTETLPVTPELARYITGYVTKKLNKKDQYNLDRYPWIKDNELEFATMSKQNGGIGLPGIKKNRSINKGS
jgi:hypothetical protein